ncbi:MAG: 2-oxoglutarate dehydrogenase E1 component, partial [Candidatus Binatia bacterium]
AERHRILEKLAAAELFESFLHTKFLGQKRFSLEGGESLVPLLNTLVEEAGTLGVEEIVIGMPHRGRLNVMANVLGKPYDQIFAEFEGSFLPASVQGDGDVKYHLGYARDHVTRTGKKLHAVLMPNPSHLEAIDPVVEGIVHAKQQYLHDAERRRVMPLLLHGDAAFCGQGVVMETMSLSELRAYHNGGTIHIIIDNQVGFTTSPSESRFTRYPSDLGKVFNAPVFHVNADDPEAAIQAARLAVGFRKEFKEDVIIDLVCYRRHGHNELDDPSFTQPAMYRKIKAKPQAHELYAERLEMEGLVTPADIEQLHKEIRQTFERALDYARDVMPRQKVFAFGGLWEGMHWAGKDWSAHTQVSADRLRTIMDAATTLPPAFNAHPKVRKNLENRRSMLEGDGAVDWACAEMLALATLLAEGSNVRLSGQDSERGTFSQRHAVLHDVETDARIVPLNKVAGQQGRFTVINSMLSEEGVLGFEYGFASADPRNLVIWEAQYGDFANNAQVIIDQFIASSESKWQRQNGLVMLLPHGYEGQGPDHSSARLERFLQLCAENNMQVCYPTTPAQYFHVLRRQQHRSFRKPLILMTPKSMLRHKLVVSRLDEFAEYPFRNVIDETEAMEPSSVRRVLLCTGKTYYDLLLGRNERVVNDIAIVRVEQLYPFPAEELRAVIDRYPDNAEIYWVQEESRNCGAWTFMEPLLYDLVGPRRSVTYVGRNAAASPATGSYAIHRQERDEILDQALRKPMAQAEKQVHVS